MKWLTIDLDEQTFKEFSKKCIDVGKKKNQVIRELIDTWLKISSPKKS